jgi:hypothetical protein
MGWQADIPYIKYDELVEAGEIDPKVLSVDDFVADYYADLIDHAYEQEKDKADVFIRTAEDKNSKTKES